jgi:hypothetical protein
MATEQIGGLQVDLERLPADLQELAPAMREWSLIDEEARDHRIEGAETEELAGLWLNVSPHLPVINTYLEGAIEGERTNEAIVVAAVAEAAFEAAKVIERRTGQAPL